jgi:hypothetical protein
MIRFKFTNKAFITVYYYTTNVYMYNVFIKILCFLLTNARQHILYKHFYCFVDLYIYC